ncbi:retrovirus-related pol polyprotein from transposon TNT 1-94 [Tanacetum coccineum]
MLIAFTPHHPSSVIDYKEDYQGELQGDAQEDKFTTTMMLLVRAITQKISTPTKARMVAIQSKNVGNAGNGNMNAGRQNRNQAANARNGLVDHIEEDDQIVQRVLRTESNPGKTNVQCYNCNAKGHYAHNYPKSKVRDAKYFKEQMLQAMKDEARGNLNGE